MICFFKNIDIPFLRIDTVSPNKISRYSCVSIFSYTPSSHDEKYVNWNEAAIRELLTIRAEAEIIRQFSEMVSAHYTRHMKGHGIFTGCV